MKGEKLNIPMMIMAGALSLLLWVVVRAQEFPQGRTLIRSVRLQQAGLDAEKYVVTKIEDEVQITSEGTDAELKSLNQADLVAVVDLTNARAGRGAYPVMIYPEQYRKSISDTALTSRVEIEPLVRKRVDVTADARGELSDPTFIASGYVVTPDQIEVQGPKSVVDMLVQVRAQLDLSKVNLASRQSYTVGVEPLGQDDRPLSAIRTEPIFVRVEPILRAAPQERLVLVVPRFKGRPAAGFMPKGVSISPEQVKIEGRSVTVASVTSVETEPIDLTGLRASRLFTVKLKLPAGIRAAAGNTIQVRVIIEQAVKLDPEPVKQGPE